WIEYDGGSYLYIEGSSSWSNDSRRAIAAIVRTRAENSNLRRLLTGEEAKIGR
ncbi:MAG: hypothetical protein HYU75_13615, partial [Betaproteobacteria bacterium]|nr:hypothetical protein [Betaproteobacteria bacterium]